jgi:hypothetical protein
MIRSLVDFALKSRWLVLGGVVDDSDEARGTRTDSWRVHQFALRSSYPEICAGVLTSMMMSPGAGM